VEEAGDADEELHGTMQPGTVADKESTPLLLNAVASAVN